MKIFILAGEPSGDALGADVIRRLNTQYADIEWRGVGGPQMQAAGLPGSLFDYTELTLMGLAEVLPRIPHILQRLKDTKTAIENFQPNVVITIDVPDFSFRLAKRLQPLRAKGMRLIHEVAPTVWAWRPGRAKKIAKLYDRLWCLFPFEPPYFKEHGLAADFIGHPVAQLAYQPNAHRNDDVLLLPGSRRREVQTLLPIFLQVADQWRGQKTAMGKSLPYLLIPTLPHLLEQVREMVGARENIRITTTNDEKYHAMQHAQMAIAASGTVTLELAMMNCPHIIAYKMNALTAWLVRRLIKTPFANLVNIILGKAVIPEFIQENCTAEKILGKLDQLNIPEQQAAFAQIRQQLQPPDASLLL